VVDRTRFELPSRVPSFIISVLSIIAVADIVLISAVSLAFVSQLKGTTLRTPKKFPGDRRPRWHLL
jgi:hypothetical protein